MNATHIRLTYDGPALDAHTMDVRMLAPALLAFGDLCEETGKLLFGDQVTTRVEVRASFRTGSFGIDLAVAPQLLQQIMGWFAGESATAAANGLAILGALGTTGGGLIAVLRWLRNRPIQRVETVVGGRRVLTDDGDSLIVEESVILLLQSRLVRTHLARVIEPIEQDGIERLAFGSDAQIDTLIERRDAVYFHVPPPEEVLLADQTHTLSFSIVNLAFKEDHKWRLSDGQNTLFVQMADAAFLERVDRNLIRFAKGDILVAETQIKQWQGADGLRTEYTIEHVIEHRPGVVQIPLPLA